MLRLFTNNNSEFVSLSAASGKTVGPNMILKVMAGDVINASGRYFYHSNNSTSGSQNPVTDAVVSLIYALTGSHASSIDKLSDANISSYLNTSGGDFSEFITSTQPNTGNSAAPKAYLNIVFLDEQFKFIKTDGLSGVGSDAQRVSSPDDANASISPMIQKAPKNGWVYVYLSNESNEPVYFDDFFVSQEHSRISEENHYYPHGLKIAGLTSPAFNKLENNYGYQGDYSESDDETGWNDFELRSYDPQIGRFIQQDPYEQFASPYIGMGNDPVNIVDPSGGYSFGPMGNAVLNHAFWTVAGFGIGYVADKITGGDGLTGGKIGGGIGLVGSFVNFRKISAWIGDINFNWSVKDLGFSSADAAAVAWAKGYAEGSIKTNREVSSFIYRDGKRYFVTSGRSLSNETDRVHHSPFNRKEAEISLPKNGRLVAFIHSHGEFDLEWDNDFSDHSFDKTKRVYDTDLMSQNDDLDFYLSNPMGELKVYRHQYRNGGYKRIMATGFYHDEKKYGPNPKIPKIIIKKDVYEEDLGIGETID